MMMNICSIKAMEASKPWKLENKKQKAVTQIVRKGEQGGILKMVKENKS